MVEGCPTTVRMTLASRLLGVVINMLKAAGMLDSVPSAQKVLWISQRKEKRSDFRNMDQNNLKLKLMKLIFKKTLNHY